MNPSICLKASLNYHFFEIHSLLTNLRYESEISKFV